MKNLFLFHLASSLKDFGKARANPHASAQNNLRLTDTCDCTDEPVCRDSLLVKTASGKTVTSIDFGGITYRADSPVYDFNGDLRFGVLGAKSLTNPADVADIIAWLTAIIQIQEVDAYVTVTPDGTSVRITHYGALTLENLVVSSGSASASRCCTTAMYYQYALSVEGAMGSVNWNDGTPAALANTPYDYSGTSGTDANTADTLSTDFGTAGGTLNIPGLKGVSVAVDDVAGKFVISYWSTSDIPAIIGTDGFVLMGKKEDFTCALPS